jgi:nucleoid-associated protein YgaU
MKSTPGMKLHFSPGDVLRRFSTSMPKEIPMSSDTGKKFETAAEADAYYRKMEADKKAAASKPAATPAVKTPQQIAADEAAAEKYRQQQVAWMKTQAAPKIITTHKLTAEETLSHLSLKYYGHATRDYWMVIYEANKEQIGDNPAHVRVGMELVIPELPDNLKPKK